MISVEGSGVNFVCAEDETIFAAMLRNRRGPVEYGCAGGGCGICKMKLLQGSYETIKCMSRAHVSSQEEEQGIVLICCVQPRGDMIIAPVNL